MIGMEILKPKMVVVISILLTSIRIRGRELLKIPQSMYIRFTSVVNKTNNKKVASYENEKLTGS